MLGPGPSNPYPEVMEAFQRPVLGHLDPDFLVVLDEIGDRLRAVFKTQNTLTLPISGTGSAGMETCFVNLLEPGDRVIVGGIIVVVAAMRHWGFDELLVSEADILDGLVRSIA